MSDDEFTKEQLEKIINDRDFDLLIGKIENEFFDCKQGIYSLKDDLNKQELAKDVSSFANKHGGYILIGPQTRKSKNHFGDEVHNISLMPRNILDSSQYYNVIRDWIYPEIDGIKVEWVASTKDNTKGIYVIRIPPQNRYTKPFLITKILYEQTSKKSEIMFGYVERRGDRSEPRRIQDIHRIQRDGLFYSENMSTRLDNLEAILLTNQEHIKKEIQVAEIEDRRQIITERVDEVLKVDELRGKRSFILTAYTKDIQTELKTLFSDVKDSIKSKLEKPKYIRPDGWHLKTGDRGKIIMGKYVRVSNFSKNIDLYRDGTLITLALVDETFLCWNRKLQITPKALIEFICNFVLFYSEVIKDLKDCPSEISFAFGFRNLWLEDEKNYMVPGAFNRVKSHLHHDDKLAPSENFLSPAYDFRMESYNIEKIAGKIISEIYLWFGIEPNLQNIPYTKIEDSTLMIDIDQIKTI